MKFKEIPQITTAKYSVDILWTYLEKQLADYSETGLNMDPDFQRGYVWTDQQKTEYVEYVLKGGISGRDIYLNHPNWMSSFEEEMVIVDGKQRISAVLDFLHDQVRAFGHLYSEFEGKLSFKNSFKFHINDIKSKKKVYQWYIDLNTGGTSHTTEEIDRVKNLMSHK